LAGLTLLLASSSASAIPGHSPVDPVDGGEDPGDQHGPTTGHLPPSSANVELVGKVTLTGVKGGIADVGAFGNYAYLAAFSPECAGRPGAQGTGVHVVDVSNPATPTKVGFIAAEPNSHVGEGVHVMDFGGRQILLHNNETCDSGLPVVSGFAVWDVTTPIAPVKVGQFGDTTPAIANQTFHTTHSVQGFVWQGKAYAVAQDNQDLKDVDIFDITPALTGAGPAVLVSEVGLEDWPGAQGNYANGDTVFHHDMQQKVIGGHNLLLVSYWDAGQVLLNIDNPASPVFVTDSDFSSPDPETGFQIPEGNSHQSYWDQDGDFVLSTDEDFSPTRTLFQITSGPYAGPYGAGEFGWTVPIPPSGLTGTTVFGGSGCEEDLNGNGVSDRSEVPSAAASGASIVVFSRGGCFFSKKVETGQLAGYTAVIIGQSHSGTRNGLLPDAFLCGSAGHAFTVTVYAICTGHRAMHLLFGDSPAYAAPEGYAAGGDLPPIGTLGSSISASTVFDGWGYVHLHEAATLAELDTYAIPEALDPAKATGFGNLTVHEVKTDPRRGVDLAYFSWYAGGLRVASFGPGGIVEVGHFIAEGGNDFWGVFPLCSGQCLTNDRDQGRGRDNAKRPLILMSDRDSGLWIFRYTGRE
jgi:hypothetical protein